MWGVSDSSEQLFDTRNMSEAQEASTQGQGQRESETELCLQIILSNWSQIQMSGYIQTTLETPQNQLVMVKKVP